MNSKQSLRRRAAFSVAWTIVRFGSDQFFNFLIFAVMSRYLTPAQFGVFVVSLVFSEFGKIIASAGLVSSLYRAPAITPQLADTVFWANLALGFLVALTGLVFAAPIGQALGSAEAAPVIATIGFVVPIAALGASHMSRRLREFGHKSLALRSVLSGLIGGTLAVVAVIYGFGVWALVVQRFTQEIITTIVAWASFRWRPGLNFSWSTLRAQLGLGGSIAGSQLLLLALARSQDVIIARMLGLAATGTYRTGWKTVELIAQGVISPFAQVALPTLSKLQHNMAEFERGYLNVLSASAAISFPAIVGVGLLADLLVPLLYGPQWHASIAVAQVLTFLVLPFSLNFFADPALTVLGKSKVIMMLASVQLVGTLAFCIAAAPFGLVAVAAAYVVRAYLTMLLQLWLFKRATGIEPRAVLSAVAPQLGASVLMAVVVLGTAHFLGPLGDHATLDLRLQRIAVLIGAGAASYALALFVLIGRTRRGQALVILRHPKAALGML